MSDKEKLDPEILDKVFKLMVTHQMESVKIGDVELKRESLKMHQSDNSLKVELEQTKRAMTRR